MTQEPQPGSRVSPTMLGDIGLFGGLDEETLLILARELPTSHVEAGQDVVREGEPSTDMFVVIGGELEVLKRSRSGSSDVRVAVFGPGDWFGEMAVLDVHPRSATVRAVAPTMLLEIGSKEVERLLYRRDLKAYSLFIMNIARELSRRLRVADGIIAKFVTDVQDEYVQKRH